MPADGGGGGDGHRDQVGATALALPSLEVAVGGRGAALTGRELVGVHAQAHRAAGAAPLAAGLLEDDVEALVLGLHPHPHRTGYDEQAGVLVDRAALDDLGGEAEVLDAAVGAGADEDGVDLDLAHRGAGLEAPCTPAPSRRATRSSASSNCAGSGTDAAERHALAGVGAPGDERRHLAGVEHDLLVEDRRRRR